MACRNDGKSSWSLSLASRCSVKAYQSRHVRGQGELVSTNQAFSREFWPCPDLTRCPRLFAQAIFVRSLHLHSEQAQDFL
jgi:hypothetical protein